MSRKVIQIVVSDEQKELIEFVLDAAGMKLSTLARRLLLEWVVAKVDMRGAMRGGVCGNAVCCNRPADYFNTANRVFICRTCAEQLKSSNDKIPIVPADDIHQPGINLDKLREAVKAELKKQKETESISTKSSAELLRVICEASAELKAREGGKERSFEDIVESFSS